MSETKNLKLFKHDEPLETNENKFDIDLALNQNWDKIDKFADTVDNKVTNLQEQNIELQSQIKKDRENMINLEVEGQSIHVEDSSDLEGQLEVLGNVEQGTREGYNLLENTLTDKTVNGITVKINKDKSITLNGTATENTSLDITKNFTITEESVFSGMCDGYGYNKMIVQIQGTDYNVNVSSATPQYIYAGTSITNALIKPQINKGTVAKPYEPYGATPSPEYPSEIRAVGDNINLLENTAKTQIVNGVTFTVNADGTVIANGTATSLAQISLVANVKLPAGTYTIKDGKAYVESTEFNDWFDGLNNPSTLTFNTEVLLKNVYIQVKQGETVNNKIFYPKLEKGTVATSHSEFGQGSAEIKKQNKNLFDILKYPFTNKVAYAPNGQLNYWTGYFGITEYFPVEENSNYVFSNDLNKPITYGLMFYNKNKEFISGIVENTIKFITPKNCKYIRFSIQSDTIPNKVQIEHGDKATEIVEHQEQTKILPIQKPMLEGDYFVKETDGWKEVHKWEKKVFDSTENIIKLTNDNYNRFVFKLPFTGIPRKAISNYYKIGNSKYEREFDVDINGINLLFHSPSKDITTVEQCKDWLKAKKDSGKPFTFFYKIVNHQKLPCTPEQTKILDELDNFQTYKPVTNITTDSIAKLKLKYIADTKTYVDNKVGNLEQQVNVINQLLSTTKTSSILLDNLQKDIESEVL